MFPSIRDHEVFRGNRAHCFPWDQSLSVYWNGWKSICMTMARDFNSQELQFFSWKMIEKCSIEKRQPFKPKPVAIEIVIPIAHDLFYAYHKKEHISLTFNPEPWYQVESRCIMENEETLPKVDSLIPLMCYILRVILDQQSWSMSSQRNTPWKGLKGAPSRFVRLENLRLQFSSSFFVILNYVSHPSLFCFVTICYDLFGVFLSK